MGLSGAGKTEEARKVLSFLAPQTLRQAVLFGALCVTAGFCEEFIFRGYLIWVLQPVLGFETTRQHVARSVIRMAPCLLGLFTVIALVAAEQIRRRGVRIPQTPWYAKQELTFSDAIATAEPSCGAGTSEKAPRKRPMGVRRAAAITAWYMSRP